MNQVKIPSKEIERINRGFYKEVKKILSGIQTDDLNMLNKTKNEKEDTKD